MGTNFFGFLQEAAEEAEKLNFPLITLMSADWMLQNPRPSAAKEIGIERTG
jgi:hypothetical protein